MLMRTVVVGLLLMVSVLGAALWGGQGGISSFAVPLLPCLVIYSAGLRWPASMPSWLVFLAGLLVDLATHGPLGYWAFIYLSVLMIAQMLPDALAQDWRARAGFAVAGMVVIGLLQFAVSSAYQLMAQDFLAISLASVSLAVPLAIIEMAVPYGLERTRGFGAETAALQRGD